MIWQLFLQRKFWQEWNSYSTWSKSDLLMRSHSLKSSRPRTFENRSRRIQYLSNTFLISIVTPMYVFATFYDFWRKTLPFEFSEHIETLLCDRGCKETKGLETIIGDQWKSNDSQFRVFGFVRQFWDNCLESENLWTWSLRNYQQAVSASRTWRERHLTSKSYYHLRQVY